MIGLMFFAAGLLWVATVWWLCKRIPAWLGFQKYPMWLSALIFPIVVCLPFVDHIIGMWQFEKLCAEQTGLLVYPNAANAKRGREDASKAELLEGTAIQIRRRVSSILDLDTGETIAQYNYFTTQGGVVGRLAMLGGEHVCSIYGAKHTDHQKYLALKAQIKLTYGEAK